MGMARWVRARLLWLCGAASFHIRAGQRPLAGCDRGCRRERHALRHTITSPHHPGAAPRSTRTPDLGSAVMSLLERARITGRPLRLTLAAAGLLATVAVVLGASPALGGSRRPVQPNGPAP